MTLNIVEDQADATYIVVVGQDTDVEEPTQYGVVRLIDEHSKVWPREIHSCQLCGEESEFPLHDKESPHRAMMQIHDFQWPDWLLGVVSRDGGFTDIENFTDFVHLDNSTFGNRGFTAYLVVVAEEFREYWADKDHDEQYEILKSTLDEFKLWADGECYWFSIEKVNHEICPGCDRKRENELVDSCGGFIGDVPLEDAIKEIVGDEPVIYQERY